jgi:hypothetical protein
VTDLYLRITIENRRVACAWTCDQNAVNPILILGAKPLAKNVGSINVIRSYVTFVNRCDSDILITHRAGK